MKFTPPVFMLTTLLLLGASACSSDEPSTTNTSEGAVTAQTSTTAEPTTTGGAEPATEDSAAITTTPAGDLSATFDEYVQAQSEINGFIGSVLVARGDEVIFEAGYGKADIESATPNSPATIHRVGSITKGFTAALVLSLQEAGELNVTDTIDRYLPDFPRGDEITVQQLLSHTAGVFNYTDDPAFADQAANEVAIDDLIATFEDRPLVFEPGTSWGYSNSGYVLLTKIIEVVSGTTYAEYLQRALAIPLGLSHTAVESASRTKFPHRWMSPQTCLRATPASTTWISARQTRCG